MRGRLVIRITTTPQTEPASSKNPEPMALPQTAAVRFHSRPDHASETRLTLESTHVFPTNRGGRKKDCQTPEHTSMFLPKKVPS